MKWLDVLPRWRCKPILWHAAARLPLTDLQKKKEIGNDLIKQVTAITAQSWMSWSPLSPPEQAGARLRRLGLGELRGFCGAGPARWLRGLSRNDLMFSVWCTPEHKVPLRTQTFTFIIYMSWLFFTCFYILIGETVICGLNWEDVMINPKMGSRNPETWKIVFRGS